jgi:hypothetical protein
VTVGSIEVAAFLVDEKDRTLRQVWTTVDFSFTGDRLEAIRRDGAEVRLAVVLKGAPKKAKGVVCDAGVDLIGSTTVDVK